jgi:2-octaprenyl-6-methoxyphenol hydroxylase
MPPDGPQPATAQYDVVIVGGGMVGASLALALGHSPLRILVIEAFEPESGQQPSFDERTSALGNGSRQVFQALGLWDRLLPEAAAIRHIHVSDAGHFGFARLNAEEFGQAAIGYVVPNRVIGRELWGALRRAAGVEVRMPARVTHVQADADGATVEFEDHRGAQRISARLVVAADGANSLVRAAAGIESTRNDYGQTAVIASLRTDRADDGTAYERFTSAGPMALLPLKLPLSGHWRALVWAASPDDAAALLALDDSGFMARWQDAFGWRAGRALQLGRRVAYPLALVRAGTGIAPRIVLLGNASQSMHPVAGQGFNLGLRDAAALAELLADAARSGDDVGGPTLLARYAAAREADREGVVRLTDTLVRGFSDARAGRAMVRNLGLLVFDALPPAKRALSRVSFGFGGASPRLTRGLPL